MPLFDRVFGFLNRLVIRIEEFLLGKEEVPMMPPPVERKPQINFPELPRIQLPQVDPRLVLLIIAIIGSVSYIAYVQYINMKLREGESLPPYEEEGEGEEEEGRKPSRLRVAITHLFKTYSPPYKRGKEEERLLEELKGKPRDETQTVSLTEIMGRVSQAIEEGVREAIAEMKEEGLVSTKKKKKVDVKKAQEEVEEMLATTPLYVDDVLKELTPEEEQLIAERAGLEEGEEEESPRRRGSRGRKRKKQIDEDLEDAIFEKEAEEEEKAEDM